MSREELIHLLSSYEVDYRSKKLFIWGTGNTASLYQEGLIRLEKEGIIISGYVDNNRDKWGTSFGGKQVISPDELVKKENVLVLIASPQPSVIKAVSEQIQSIGADFIHIDTFVLCLHKNEVISCFDLFTDERSRQIYAELIECRISGRYPTDEYVDKGQYFSFHNFGDYDANEVFVDCGAFVGDSLEQYIWSKDGTFKKIIAFEPDKANVSAMNYRLDRLKREWNLSENKFIIYPYGISDSSSVSYIQRYEANNGFGSKMLSNGTAGSEEIKCIAIDDCINEPYHFLKADIESYEYKLLCGARRTICEFKPKLAICIYHNVVDFYSIPLLIKDICPEYKLSIRHYTHLLSDTVLYAYI